MKSLCTFLQQFVFQSMEDIVRTIDELESRMHFNISRPLLPRRLQSCGSRLILPNFRPLLRLEFPFPLLIISGMSIPLLKPILSSAISVLGQFLLKGLCDREIPCHQTSFSFFWILCYEFYRNTLMRYSRCPFELVILLTLMTFCYRRGSTNACRTCSIFFLWLILPAPGLKKNCE